ncbi:hypothetical protein CL614_01140 [archaeon]|nr:hypothetical protein [archaeon]
MKLVLIKFGGSVITDKTKPYTPQNEIIKQLAEEIHQFHQENPDTKIILGHGGGSFPHTSAKKYETHKGFINDESVCGLAKVQNDAARLNRIIVQALIDAGENAMSMQPSSFCITEKCKITESYTKPMEKMLEKNMIPVPYGDVGIDLEQGCCIISTEEILNHLAEKFEGKKIIEVGNTPVLDEGNQIIKEITKDNFESIQNALGGSGGAADVTGGMLHKVELALQVAEKNIETHIIDGTQQGNLLRTLNNENTGTRIY